jgi:AcrR family transcriptional regulator
MTRSARAQRGDGEATRARILEAAGELFASTGFAETTSKAIAARADVDLALINYHFGSRSGLYQAVLVEAHRRFMDLADLQALAQNPVSAHARFKALLSLLVVKAANGKDGWHMAVLAAEMLAPSSHIQALFQTVVPQKVSLVIGMLSEITAIPAHDPALLRCLLSVAAPCLLMQLSARGAPTPVQGILRLPHEVIVDHLYAFSVAGLEAIGREYVLRSQESGERP